jgi:hypothetical protein
MKKSTCLPKLLPRFRSFLWKQIPTNRSAGLHSMIGDVFDTNWTDLTVFCCPGILEGCLKGNCALSTHQSSHCGGPVSVPPVMELWVQISSKSLSMSIHSWGLPSSNFLTYFLYLVASEGCPTQVFKSNAMNLPFSSSIVVVFCGINGRTWRKCPNFLTLGILLFILNISFLCWILIFQNSSLNGVIFAFFSSTYML